MRFQSHKRGIDLSAINLSIVVGRSVPMLLLSVEYILKHRNVENVNHQKVILRDITFYS